MRQMLCVNISCSDLSSLYKQEMDLLKTTFVLSQMFIADKVRSCTYSQNTESGLWCKGRVFLHAQWIYSSCSNSCRLAGAVHELEIKTPQTF